MYAAMKIDDESMDKCYVLQWTSEPYMLQEDKEMKGHTSTVIVYAGEIVCDPFFNPVPNVKYQLTNMNKKNADITV